MNTFLFIPKLLILIQRIFHEINPSQKIFADVLTRSQNGFKEIKTITVRIGFCTSFTSVTVKVLPNQ